MADIVCGLDKCFLCKHCLPSWKQLIAVKKSTRLYKRGRKIFMEGDPVNGIYFLNEGSVKISRNWGGHKDLIIRFAKGGDIVGHRGFGTELVYPITATSLEDSVVCFIENELLDSTLLTNNSFTYRFMQEYAKELQRAEKRMWDLVHREVRERIILALFEIADAFGTMDDNFIAIPITRQDIAAYAGSSYETVFKLFSDLTAKSILTTVGKNIKINDRAALVAMLEKSAVRLNSQSINTK